MTLRVSTGLERLDQMLGGGLLPRTLTVVYGATGIGKTHLSLGLAAAGRRARPAVRHDRARRLAAAPRLRGAALRLAARPLDPYRDAHVRSLSAGRADGGLLLRRVPVGRQAPRLPGAHHGRPRVRLELEGDGQPGVLHRATVRLLPPGRRKPAARG